MGAHRVLFADSGVDCDELGGRTGEDLARREPDDRRPEWPVRDMSYELIFWRQRPGAALDPYETYTALNDGKVVNGLMTLPIGDIVDAVTETFVGAVRERNGPQEWVVWDHEGKVLEMTWSSQHLRFDCRTLTGPEMNRVIDVAASFDCPLYDPQTGERFAPEDRN